MPFRLPASKPRIHSRIVEHPLGIVILADSGFGGKQRRIEANRVRKVGDADVDM